MSQIYATLEEAQQLKNEGWEKPCVHYVKFKSGLYNFDNACVFYLDKKIEEIEVLQTDFPESLLQLPTLGEIELPSTIIVCQFFEKWKVLQYTFASPQAIDMPNNYEFETELSARIHAWIYAKQNNLLP